MFSENLIFDQRPKVFLKHDWGGYVHVLFHDVHARWDDIPTGHHPAIHYLQRLETCTDIWELRKMFLHEPPKDEWVNLLNSPLLDAMTRAFVRYEIRGNYCGGGPLFYAPRECSVRLRNPISLETFWNGLEATQCLTDEQTEEEHLIQLTMFLADRMYAADAQTICRAYELRYMKWLWFMLEQVDVPPQLIPLVAYHNDYDTLIRLLARLEYNSNGTFAFCCETAFRFSVKHNNVVMMQTIHQKCGRGKVVGDSPIHYDPVGPSWHYLYDRAPVGCFRDLEDPHDLLLSPLADAIQRDHVEALEYMMRQDWYEVTDCKRLNAMFKAPKISAWMDTLVGIMSTDISVSTQADGIRIRGKGTYSIRGWLNKHRATFNATDKSWLICFPTDLTEETILQHYADTLRAKQAASKRKRSESMQKTWKRRKLYQEELTDIAKRQQRLENYEQFRTSQFVNFFNGDDTVDTVCRHCHRFHFSEPITKTFFGCPHCGKGGP